MKKIGIFNGPNLNRLGTRQPEIYGYQTLQVLEADLRKKTAQHAAELYFFQTQEEGQFIQAIHHAADNQTTHLIINAAAWTHTSIAIRDALICVRIPFIEVHISNIYAREPFRHVSYLSDIAEGVISGLGVKGYHLALEAILSPLSTSLNG